MAVREYGVHKLNKSKVFCDTVDSASSGHVGTSIIWPDKAAGPIIGSPAVSVPGLSQLGGDDYCLEVVL